jgi:KDO2-lipid IV(A) lauroyltransferase
MNDAKENNQGGSNIGLLAWSELTTTKARGFKILFTMIGVLPLWANHLLGNAVGLLLLAVPNRHRRVAWENLTLCFPGAGTAKRLWWLLRTLQEGTKCITEMAWLWTKPPEKLFSKIREIHGLEVLDDPLAHQRPILFAAPHLGCWELLNLYLSSRCQCTMLYRESHDTGVEAFIQHSRQRLGANLIRADARGVRRMIKRLRLGDLVGILPDHQPRRGQGVFKPFFGHKAYTMVLLPKLIHHDTRPTPWCCCPN